MKHFMTVTGILLFISCHTTSKNQAATLDLVPENLVGIFKDDYGSTYRITKKQWSQDASIKYQLLAYNKEENFFIAKNDPGNPSEAGLYSRIDILYFENMEPWRWGFCLTAYKARTIDEAYQTAAADRSNPRKGCGGFPFTRMRRE